MQNAYETYNNMIGLRLSYVLTDIDRRAAQSVGLISYSAYKLRAHRSETFRLRDGRGPGNEVLLNWVALPHDWQQACIDAFGDPTKGAAPNQVMEYYSRCPKAADFYANYTYNDGEKNLKAQHITEYITNASVLNAFIKAEAMAKAKRKAMGGSTAPVRDILMNDVERMRDMVGHTLKMPSFRRTLKLYKEDGPVALINGRFGNDNSRKVTAMVESMLLSLYSMPNKPFAVSVHQLYLNFLDGKIDVVDRQTGEYFNREDFKRNGEYIEISEATVWNYINNPLNRALVDKSRLDALDYNNTHRPHARRHAPNYSFSKISMDDRDLPRKLNTGGRVKAYYAYDVASGAVIGRAYSRSKDEALFIDCLRDMFRLMDRQGWGVPMEVEVENHLVNKFFDDLAVMFPILRICAPGNSQEKHAEHYNKAKKYSTEKAKQTGIGRWWARSEAYRTKRVKVNDEYVEKTYDYNALLADDLQAINDYNSQPHPKQKKYPGMSRWQVLCYKLNPELVKPNRAVWVKAIGDVTRTSITRSKYLTVKNETFELPNPAVISKLKPNNYTVEAYYLKNEFNEVKEVYLYQAGEYLCRCEVSSTWNTARAEWTEADVATAASQAAYTAKYDSMIKTGRAEKIMKPEIISTNTTRAMQAIEVDIVPPPAPPPEHFNLDAALLKWGGDWMTERAINDI
jgi:hypothetical protein